MNLVEVDLSNNCISQLQGLAGLKYLRKLVLTCNRIRAVDGLSGLDNLEHLLLQGNPIATVPSINLAMLSGLKNITSLYLRNVDGSEVCPVLYCLSALHSATIVSCLALQACPVCLNKEYKAAVLSALPQLTNMDGERSPHACTYHDTLAEAHKATERLKMYRPQFECDPPEQWFSPGMLEVPAVTSLSVPTSMSTAVKAADNRLTLLETTLKELLQHSE